MKLSWASNKPKRSCSGEFDGCMCMIILWNTLKASSKLQFRDFLGRLYLRLCDWYISTSVSYMNVSHNFGSLYTYLQYLMRVNFILLIWKSVFFLF